MPQDSSLETLQHIKRVSFLLTMAAKELLDRAAKHDESKLHEPEKSQYDACTPFPRSDTYYGKEYKKALEKLKSALHHHYAENSHHPQHWENGIEGFDLFDLMEMLCDWVAASERHDDGDIVRSISIGKERFKYSDRLATLMLNTVNRHIKVEV